MEAQLRMPDIEGIDDNKRVHDSKRILLFLVVDIVLLVSTSSVFLLSHNTDLFSNVTQFITVNILLLLYILFNLRREYKRQGKEVFTSTLFVFYLFHYVLQGIVSNFSVIDGYTLPLTHLNYLIKTEYIYVLACVSFTLGYRSRFNNFIGSVFMGLAPVKKILTGSFNRNKLHRTAAVMCLILGSCVYAVGLKTGVLGYSRSNNLSSIQSSFGYQQYLVYLSGLIYMAFYSFYLELHRDKKSLFPKIMFMLSTLTVIVFGLLNGMKAALFSPFIFLLFMGYSLGKKINIKVLLIAFITLYLSYLIVEPYKELSRVDTSSSRIQLLVQVVEHIGTEQSQNTFGISLLRRVNQTEAAANVIYYADKVGVGRGDPNFMRDLIVSPLSTFLPRAFFPWKPVGTYGLWVTQKVYGYSTVLSSSYITIEGYLYLAGGIPAILIVMFIFGSLSKLAQMYLYNRSRLTPVLLVAYIMLLENTFFEPADPVQLIVGLLRGAVIYPVLAFLFFKKPVL